MNKGTAFGRATEHSMHPPFLMFLRLGAATLAIRMVGLCFPDHTCLMDKPEVQARGRDARLKFHDDFSKLPQSVSFQVGQLRGKARENMLNLTRSTILPNHYKTSKKFEFTNVSFPSGGTLRGSGGVC